MAKTRSQKIRQRASYKRSDIMAKNNTYKYILMPVIFILVFTVIIFMYFISHTNSNYKTIEYIKSYQTSTGKLVDFQNKIGVRGIEDVQYYVYDGKFQITFGDHIMIWDKEDFYKEDNIVHLSQIGIEVDFNENTKELHVYYKGDEVPKYYMEDANNEAY